jgi:tetratricopeptide (TPR) repeat protein
VEQIEEIREWYTSKLRSVIANPRAAQQLKSERNARIRSLLDDKVGASPHGQLNFDDLIAAARGYEYLKEYDHCIHICKRAIEVNSESDKPYFPLMRSLINLGQLEEAEKVFQSDKKRFPSDSSFYALHGILYAGWNAGGQFDQAADHMSDYVKYLFTVADKQSWIGNSVGKFLDLEREAYARSGHESLYSERLEQYRAQITKKLRWMEKRTDPTKENLGDVSLLGSMYHAQFEVIKRSEPEAVEDCLHEWLSFVIQRAVRQPANEKFQVELATALKEFARHLFYISQTSSFEPIFEHATKQLEQFRKTASQGTDDLKRLHEGLRTWSALIGYVANHRELVGTVATELTDIKWVGRGATTLAELKAEKKVVLLYFWDPGSPGGVESLHNIQQLQTTFSSEELCIIAVGRFCGFSWNPSKGQVWYSNGISEADELRAMETFLNDGGFKISAGMVSESSTLAAAYRVNVYPEIVLIDRNGAVRAVEIGAYPEVIKHTESTIAILTAKQRVPG